jgi:hypothetical protein
MAPDLNFEGCFSNSLMSGDCSLQPPLPLKTGFYFEGGFGNIIMQVAHMLHYYDLQPLLLFGPDLDFEGAFSNILLSGACFLQHLTSSPNRL